MPSTPLRSIAVPAAADLQAALNSAQAGDELVLAQGAIFTGHFTLPVHASDGWVIVRGAETLPAFGERMTPALAQGAPQLVTPDGDAVLTAAPAAHHWRIIGLDLHPAAGQDVNDLVILGIGTETDPATLPHDLILDRLYIHGDPIQGGKRGVRLNSATSAIVGCTISDWKRVGQDTQAILGWNGPGPYLIAGNDLEGAGENVLFGGADPAMTNQVPSDIAICHNHFWKPRAWKMDDPSFQGTLWSVKNLFELKMGRRVLVVGNVFEQCWPQAQTGFGWVIKSANQDGKAPWSQTEQVTLWRNLVRRTAAAANISPSDPNTPLATDTVRVEDNLFVEIGTGDWAGNGNLFQILGVASVRIIHNTGFAPHATINADGISPNFLLRDNLLERGMYGVKGSGLAEGNSTFATNFPGSTIVGNGFIGADAASYPVGNFFPADDASVGFVDLAGGDYHLETSSALFDAASDGSDVGADITALLTEIAGVAP